MATFAIGDIHGQRAALDDLLRQVRPHVEAGDTVVFLGDYIDRGRDTKGCVDAILAFRDDVAGDVVCLCGNHEDWMLKTLRDHRRHSWLLGMDGLTTIDSYSTAAALAVRAAMADAGVALFEQAIALPYDRFLDAMPPAHLAFFRDLRDYHRTPDCLCVHGGLDPSGGDAAAQARHDLIWGGAMFPDAYEGTELIVYGHRNNAVVDADGWPRPAVAGATIGIDTIAHGVLTAIRLPDRRLFQSARYERRRPRD
jgi:serine/threonine protein phosphatase 1